MPKKVKSIDYIKSRLETQFGSGKARIQGDSVKTHVKSLDEVDIYMLDRFNQISGCKISIKRSGTGLTIIVSLQPESYY